MPHHLGALSNGRALPARPKARLRGFFGPWASDLPQSIYRTASARSPGRPRLLRDATRSAVTTVPEEIPCPSRRGLEQRLDPVNELPNIDHRQCDSIQRFNVLGFRVKLV